MNIQIPKDTNEVTKTLFDIMNNRPNGVRQTFDKQQLLKTHFDLIVKENDSKSLLKEFTDAMNLYIDLHIDKWGFFNFDRDFFLLMIKQ